MKQQIPLNNTNLNITSKGNDKNGNYCIGLKFNNDALSFSIQTGGNLKNTGNLIKGKDLSKLTEQDLLIIENEVVNYIKKYGSPKQKKSLKTYFNEMNSGDINVYDAPGGGINWNKDLNKNYEEQMITENEQEIKIGDSIEFKHLLSSKTFKGKYKDDYEKGWIMVDCGRDGMVVVKKNDKSIKLLSENRINEATTPQFQKLIKRAKALKIETVSELEDLILDEFNDESKPITGADYEIACKQLKLIRENKNIKIKVSDTIKLIENKTGKKVLLEEIGDPGVYYKFTSLGIKMMQELHKIMKDPSFDINSPFDVDYLNEMRIKISTDNFFKTLLRASMIVETNLD